MNYLKDYNIDDRQIEKICKILDLHGIDKDMFIYDPEKIIEVLDLFKNIGVNNFYDLIVTSPSMFCDTVKSIKKRIDSYDDKEKLANLLNENASNLILIDLL